MTSDIKQMLNAHGLDHIFQDLARTSKPSFRMLTETPIEDTDALTSRLGGHPWLPAGFDWPARRSGVPLAFVCQIWLPDIAGLSPEIQLPTAGLLSFFYEAGEQPWGGFEQTDSWRVFHFDTDALSGGARMPTEATATFGNRSVGFRPQVTYPASRSIWLERLSLQRNQYGEYYDFLDEISGVASPRHRLGGHPDAIQGCMQIHIQFESHNERLPKGVHNFYQHPKADELFPGVYDWELLLQVDSDPSLGMMWGDAGRIYYWIRHEDLVVGDFDKCWLQLQCY